MTKQNVRINTQTGVTKTVTKTADNFVTLRPTISYTFLFRFAFLVNKDLKSDAFTH